MTERPPIGFLPLDQDLYLWLLLVLHLVLLSGRLDGNLGRSVCGLGRSDAIRLMFLGLGVLSGTVLESVLFSGNSLSSSSVANNCMSI